MITRNDRILIVEDEAADAILLKRALFRIDPLLRIEVAEDGEDALARLLPDGDAAGDPGGDDGGDTGGDAGGEWDIKTGQAAQPACVLLDLKLRKLDGHAVLRAIKAEAVTRSIPVIVLTSSSDPTDIDLAYQLGANSYIVKPVRAADLNIVAGRIYDYWLHTNQFPGIRHVR
jgi:two-component system response regulator